MIETPEGEIIVGVGDFRVAGSPARFLATYGLGSCVAVLLYDWRARTGALLHVMMPDSSIEPAIDRVAHNGRPLPTSADECRSYPGMKPDQSSSSGSGLRAPDPRKHPFAYVDTAVPRMFEATRAAGMSPRRTRCCIVGGAAMSAGPCHFQTGRRNVMALRKALSRQGVFIDHEEIGGRESRSVRLDLRTGGVSMRKGGRAEFVLAPPSVIACSLDTNAITNMK